MAQITQKTLSASEAIVDSMISVMATFTSYTTRDFYGDDTKQPMTSAHFFGVCGLVEKYGHEVEKRRPKGGNNKWRL